VDPAPKSGSVATWSLWLVVLAFVSGVLACVGWAGAPASQAVLAPDPKTCEGYPEKRVYLEAQSWWETQPGPPDHPGTGKQGHIHVGTCFPLFQRLTGPSLHLDVFVQLHNLPSRVDYLSVDIEAGRAGTLYHGLVPGFRRTCPTADCSEWVGIDVPLTSLRSSGWASFNILAHATTTDGRAQRVLSRWWAYVANGKRTHKKPSDGPAVEGTGWFAPGGPAGKYAGAHIANGDIPWDAATGQAIAVTGTWRPAVSIRREAFVLVDPALHANPPSLGKVVLSNVGEWNRTEKLAIDTTALTDGRHRLLIASCDPRPDGRNCGVLVVPFVVQNNPPATGSSPPGGSPAVVLGRLQSATNPFFTGRTRAIAGRTFYARVPASDSATGAALPNAHVTCRGRIGDRAVPARAISSAGYAVCAFRLPTRSAGSLLDAEIGVQVGAIAAVRPLRVRIHRAAPTSNR
jgi:hypothetical protein